MFMPNLQNDDLSLVRRQFREAVHRGPFIVRFRRLLLEPPKRLELPGKTPPQAAPKIQRAIAKTANAEMLRLVGRFGPFQQGGKCFVQDILRFRMRKSQGAAVQQQVRRFRAIHAFAPIWLISVTHDFNR